MNGSFSKMMAAGPRGMAMAALLLTSALSLPSAASAQLPVGTAASIHGGIFQYDLAGTGTVRHLAARLEVPVDRIVGIEGSVGYSRPGAEPDEATTMLIPELQARAEWPGTRLAPFFGLGVGAAVVLEGAGQNGRDTDLTVAGAGGMRLRVSDRLALQGELRVRGIGSRFQGSSSEWTTGLVWRL
jgi:hypothetical protein